MLKTSDLQSLKKHFQVKSFKKGEVIFPQGQVANGAYIVIKGLVHLKKKHKEEKLFNISEILDQVILLAHGIYYLNLNLEQFQQKHMKTVN